MNIKTPPPLPAILTSFVKLWPSLIAALSLVAVWGSQSTTAEQRNQRTLMSAGQWALPELRAVPAPTPAQGLAAAPNETLRVEVPTFTRRTLPLGHSQIPPRMPDLQVLGRQQTDGG